MLKIYRNILILSLSPSSILFLLPNATYSSSISFVSFIFYFDVAVHLNAHLVAMQIGSVLEFIIPLFKVCFFFFFKVIVKSLSGFVLHLTMHLLDHL